MSMSPVAVASPVVDELFPSVLPATPVAPALTWVVAKVSQEEVAPPTSEGDRIAPPLSLRKPASVLNRPIKGGKSFAAPKAKGAQAPANVGLKSAAAVAAAREARLNGLQALANGQMQRARAALESALTDLPGDAELLSGLSEATFELGDYQSARSYARRAVGSAPRATKNYLLLGDVCFKMSLLPEAVKAYKTASVLAPNDASIRSRLARAEGKL
jgi:tetratricopeptide (TPR) repeat protein